MRDMTLGLRRENPAHNFTFPSYRSTHLKARDENAVLNKKMMAKRRNNVALSDTIAKEHSVSDGKF